MNEAASVAVGLETLRRTAGIGRLGPISVGGGGQRRPALRRRRLRSAGGGSLPAPSTGLRRCSHGLRVGADRGEISRHGGSLLDAGRIVLAHERSGRALDLARAAVAGVAGMGEDLRRRLAGIEVGLGERRNRGQPRPPSPKRLPRSLLRWSPSPSRPVARYIRPLPRLLGRKTNVRPRFPLLSGRFPGTHCRIG